METHDLVGRFFLGKISITVGPAPVNDNTDTGATGREVPNLENVPEIYHDLWQVFNEKECDCLPLHCTTDCAIELKPGVSLCTNHVCTR